MVYGRFHACFMFFIGRFRSGSALVEDYTRAYCIVRGAEVMWFYIGVKCVFPIFLERRSHWSYPKTLGRCINGGQMVLSDLSPRPNAVANIAETYHRLSRVHERYRPTTDRQTDRQTDGRQQIAKREFTFAKNRRGGNGKHPWQTRDTWDCEHAVAPFCGGVNMPSRPLSHLE